MIKHPKDLVWNEGDLPDPNLVDKDSKVLVWITNEMSEEFAEKHFNYLINSDQKDEYKLFKDYKEFMEYENSTANLEDISVYSLKYYDDYGWAWESNDFGYHSRIKYWAWLNK